MPTKNVTIRDVQLNALKTLTYVDGVCRRHGLRYFLSGGTLLGAVRHKGFIPWDDDVDIMMPRRDYERLNQILTAEADPRFLSGCVETDPEWTYAWARVWDKNSRVCWDEKLIRIKDMGIFVDIFPIDGLPESPLVSKLYFKWLYWLNSLRNAAIRGSFRENEQYRAVKRLIAPYARKKGERAFVVRMNKIARKYDFDKCAYAGVSMTVHYGKRERLPASVFASAVDVDFEGLKLPAPVGYDAYLRSLYGDYMKLPPEEARVSDHIFYISLPDEPK